MAKKKSFRIPLLVILGLLLVGAAETVRQMDYSKFSKKHYLTAKETQFIRPGLNVEVLDTVLVDRAVTVTIKITDDKGATLDIRGIDSPGAITANMILAYINPETGQYTSLTNRTQTSPITGDSAVQPTSVSATSSMVELEDGVYSYTFDTLLPEDYDENATHSVGMYLRRDLTEWDLGREVANEVVHFVPSGGEVANIRDVVRTETCNTCHDTLALHGGSRQKVELCIMCHTDGVVDPDTGESVDMDVMIHKIHMGHNLPSVQAGESYAIIGFRQSVHDYSTVGYPQDVRNCESCHTPDAAQADAYLFNPNRESCGSCHDDVNFATGENHINMAQISDNQCANCHFPEGELEFDASILGAHTIPAKSKQLEGINIEILDVVDSTPGDFPTVRFNLKNNDGETIAPEDVDTLRFLIAGPNDDFTVQITESALDTMIPYGMGYSYTFTTAIPDDAAGSYTMGAEAYRNVLLNEGLANEFSIRETSENPVFSFAVTDDVAVPRRTIVSDAKCDSCHENLALHGTIRHGPEYCVMCHQPSADDSPYRAAEDMPARSIDFKFMIHRIHMGEELAADYTIIGFRGTPHNYNEVLYPGDQSNCETCHVGNSYEVPTPGIEPTITPYEFYSPIPANSSACLACHDSLDAAAHTFVNTSPFGESCGVCHGPNGEMSVSRVHAKP
jgi:OmcA/MtrC family decaheme c-type cytochrome